MIQQRVVLGMFMVSTFTALVAAAATWHVDDGNTTTTHTGSATYPFATVQAGVDACATSGDEVKVAAGTYAASVAVVGKAVTLTGGWPGADPASYAGGTGGDFTSRDPVLYPSLVQGTVGTSTIQLEDASGTTVDGLVIRGGDHGVELVGWPPQDLVTIAGCVIEDNGVETSERDHVGGGIYLSGLRVTIRDNVIRSNDAGLGAGIGGGGDGFVIQGNLIENNTGWSDHGGGLFLGGSGLVTGNVVRGNVVGAGLTWGWGGGALILDTITLSHNLWTDNTSIGPGGGIFVDEGADALLEHEIVWGNHSLTEWASGGAGIYVDGAGDDTPSFATIVNCTVAGNSSPGTDGGNAVYATAAAVTVKDSIFWGNGDDVFAGNAATVTVTHTLAGEVLPGTGNLVADPLFADAAAGDFHLRSSAGRWSPTAGAWLVDATTSPGVDAGDPGAAFAAEVQPNGGRRNLGAWGNTPEASRSPGSTVVFADGFDTAGTAPWSASVP